MISSTQLLKIFVFQSAKLKLFNLSVKRAKWDHTLLSNEGKERLLRTAKKRTSLHPLATGFSGERSKDILASAKVAVSLFNFAPSQ